jgi:hypothetical protein
MHSDHILAAFEKDPLDFHPGHYPIQEGLVVVTPQEDGDEVKDFEAEDIDDLYLLAAVD